MNPNHSPDHAAGYALAEEHLGQGILDLTVERDRAKAERDALAVINREHGETLAHIRAALGLRHTAQAPGTKAAVDSLLADRDCALAEVDRLQKMLGTMTGRVHDLKTWPGPFEGVKLGIKSLELRFNDRDFHPGDILHLREWNPETGEYTGDAVHRLVTYIMFGGQWGLAEGWVAMTIITPAVALTDQERDRLYGMARGSDPR